MTIRFSCTCGAVFEVSEENAGRRGKCARCGSEMTIPHVSEQTTSPGLFAHAHEGHGNLPRELPDEAPPFSNPLTRYCPFCGREVSVDDETCPHCLRQVATGGWQRFPAPKLTIADWILVTFLAPLGFLGGFVSLIVGNRKGLYMIGVSTLSMLLMWFVVTVTTRLAG